MNYQRMHDAIIENRKMLGRPNGYSENHHIIPKSMGGSNEHSNLIRLTAREHFIIHRLLAKIHPNSGMVHAVYKMSCVDRHWGTYKVKSRTYEYIREQHAYRVSNDKVAAKKKSDTLSGKKQTKEHAASRAKSRKSNGYSWHKEETKAKISESNKGKVGTWSGKSLPKDMVEKRNNTRFANGNYYQSEETRRKISESHIGVKRGPQTESHKAKQRKTYLVNGKIVVTNAKQFCLDNNINYGKFISAANNSNFYKHFHIIKIET